MKKIVVGLFLLAMSISLYAQSGIIRELSGTVELKNAGAADFVAAQSGDRVSEDTVISTGFRSTALVEVGSTIITVRPLTRLTLTEISIAAGQETLNANLQAGRVRVDVSPPAGTRASMSVSSPSATASVRGTTLFFDGRNLGVTGGTGTLQGDRGPPVMVGDGFNSSVGQGGKPSNPIFTGMGGGEVLAGGDGILFTGPEGSDPNTGADSLGAGYALGLTDPDDDTPTWTPPPGNDYDHTPGSTITIGIQYLP
jgi:hypothetical protein